VETRLSVFGLSASSITACIVFGLCAGCSEEPAHDHGDHSHDPAEMNSDCTPSRTSGDFTWQLPSNFPIPDVPVDNPMSLAKVELGKHLFYDTRLSLNQKQSCASCHHQDKAFTDGLVHAIGSTGEAHPRNSMSLANVAYASALTWSSSLLRHLEQQASVPIFGANPVELGLRGQEAELTRRLTAEPRYQQLFPKAFPNDSHSISVQNTVRALSAFQRTLISGNSAFDRFQRGDKTAISEAARRGNALFQGERMECFHCHSGFNLQDSIHFACKSTLEMRFHNTGLYNLGNAGAYPASDTGLYQQTTKPEDMGKFRVPTLRNIAVTAPYMHDGSIENLSEVLDHYAAGGRKVATGPNAGDGSKNPLKSGLIRGFTLSAVERSDVLEFFKSLTDDNFLKNPAYANPWPSPCVNCP